MKRNFKLMILTLLCTLSFTLASCAKTALPEPNGGNTTEQPDNNNQGDTGNNNQGGNTQQPDVKPVQSHFTTASSLGFTGTEAEWNAKMDEINKILEEHFNEMDMYSSTLIYEGEGKPNESIDLKYTTYYDKLTHQVYYRDSKTNKWKDKGGIPEYSDPENVIIYDVDATLNIFDNNNIKVVVYYGLSNGYCVLDLKDITVSDVKLSSNKFDLALPNSMQELSLVVSGKLNEKNIKFNVPLDTKLIVKHDIKNEVGTYNLTVNLEGINYPLTIEVINSQLTVFEAAKKLGYYGTLETWNKEVAQYIVDDLERICFVEGIIYGYGTTEPNENIGPEVDYYINTINHKTYFKDPTTNKWIDQVELSPTDKITLGSDIDVGYVLCEDGKVRYVEMYFLSNGYSVSDIKDINISKIEISTTSLSLSDPNFNNALYFTITLPDKSSFKIPLKSSLVKHEITNNVGTYEATISINGIMRSFKVQVTI